MIFLATLPSANENFEYKSNPIPQPLHTYISGSAFFANLTPINKRPFKVKSEFKSLYLIYKKYRKFIIFGGLKVAFFFFFFKQLPLNIKKKFEFFDHMIDGERLLSVAVEVVSFLVNNPLHFHDKTFSVSPSLFPV